MEVPALNDRLEDIPLLVEHFVGIICNEYGTSPKECTKGAIKALQQVNWTGNIRELRNVVERLIILSGEKITEEDVKNYVSTSSTQYNKLGDLFEKYENLDDLIKFVKSEYDKYALHKV
jgi:DNA-binding NtrC family response regulator